MEIGKRIRQLRTNKGVTQEELANALNVSNQAVSRWETGITMPDIYLLPSIALFFGVTIDEIFNPSPEEKLERLRRRFYYTEDYLSDDEFRSALSFLKEQEGVYDDTADIWHLLAQLYLNRIEKDKKIVEKYAKKAMRLSADKSFCVRFLTDSEQLSSLFRSLILSPASSMPSSIRFAALSIPFLIFSAARSAAPSYVESGIFVEGSISIVVSFLASFFVVCC